MKKRIIGFVLLLCLFCLSGCNKQESDVVTTSESNSVDSGTVTTEYIEPELVPMSFVNTVKCGGTFVYDILFNNVDNVNLTPDYVILSDDLTADISVGVNETDPDLYSIVLSDVQGLNEAYTITIAEGAGEISGKKTSPFTFTLNLTDNNISNYVVLNCVSSDTMVDDGVLTVTAKYEGITSAKFMTCYLDESFIKLHNCTGNLKFETINNGLSTCIILSDIVVTDKSLPCVFEILGGSATDVDGSPTNGYKLEFEVL